MATKVVLDLDGLEQVKSVATQLIADYGTLRANQLECEDAYFMDWKDSPSGDVKQTTSPDAHNKVRGASRLLSSSEPQFNLPKGKNPTDVSQNSSVFEQAANTMWAASNLVQGINAERDLAHCGTLYGEMHARVISTKDMLVSAQAALSDNKDKTKVPLLQATVTNLEIMNARTPFIFTPLDPMTCYVSTSRAGLECHYQQIDTTVGDAIASYGDDALRVFATNKSYEKITLNIFYDRANVYVWAEGQNDPILAGPHGKDFIPVAYYSPEGSTVYRLKERKIIPFLYPVIKSGVWQRQNLFLTVTATAAAALLNSQFVFEQGSDDAEVVMDLSKLGGVIKVPAGSKLYPLAKDIINSQLVQQYQMYDQLMNESTIYDQTLGQPLTGSPTYSEVSLMHQAGRLPLKPIQDGMASLCANLMGIAFRWMKDEGNQTIKSADGTAIEVDVSLLTNYMNFNVTVDVSMPTDNIQNAQAAASLAETGLTSKEWIREGILNIGQSDVEQGKIWEEQMSTMAAQQLFPAFIQMLASRMNINPVAPVAGGNGAQPTQPTGNPPEQQPVTPLPGSGNPTIAGQ